jgi:hypothetical protein
MAAVATRKQSVLSPKINETEVTGYWVASISPLEKSLGKSYRQSPFRPKSSLFSFEANVDRDRYSHFSNQHARPAEPSKTIDPISHGLESIASERIRLLALKAAKKMNSNEINARLFVLNERMDFIAPPVSEYTSSRLSEIHESIRKTDSFLDELDSYLSS